MDKYNLEKYKFSVLMSVYYKEKPENLDGCIESILNQDIVPNEIVIVKDGILDQELENVIDRYVRIYKSIFKIVELSENVGLGNALNEGLKHCSYELVARMDSDDICNYGRFRKQIEVFINNKELSVVGSYIDEYDENMEVQLSTKKVPIENDKIINYLKHRNPFNHMSIMYRRSDVIDSGMYIEIRGFEDYYLWYRMLNSGYKSHNIDESLLKVRAGDSLISRRIGISYFKNELYFQKMILNEGYISFFDFIRNILIRGIPRLLPFQLLRFIYFKVIRKGIYQR